MTVPLQMQSALREVTGSHKGPEVLPGVWKALDADATCEGNITTTIIIIFITIDGCPGNRRRAELALSPTSSCNGRMKLCERTAPPTKGEVAPCQLLCQRVLNTPLAPPLLALPP